MSSVLLFCTSSQVTPQLVHDLNEHCGKDEDDPTANFFTPARRDPKQVVGPRDTHPEYVVDPFEAQSESQLRQLFKERFLAAETGNVLEPYQFAVLDERSPDDKTIVLHYQHLDNVDDETSDRMSWRSWRIRFGEAWRMSVNLTTADIAYPVYLKHGDRFVDEDGILAVEEAWKNAP
ncbi:MAG: hypothetical protein M1823_004426 [Watsoniomyces obsoletus]|nr:MAG: hypothetical protein M1823_004426 [Watsoniomyces obsoletus]